MRLSAPFMTFSVPARLSSTSKPDYLVSLSDIAERCDLSRSAVSLFTKGERREGFPPPVARVTTDSPLWDWVHVARWMYRNRRVSLEAVVQAEVGGKKRATSLRKQDGKR